MVIAPNEDGEWVEKTRKKEMEEAIIDHHMKKYSFTHATPPMKAPLRWQLGFDSLTPTGESVLNGTYSDAPGTDRYCKLLLQNLARKTEKMIPTGMTTTDYQEGW
jgi:hypothetical protein